MSNKTKQQKPKSMPVKHSMHALLQVLKEKGADEHNPIPKREALLGVKEYLRKKGLLGEHDLSLNESGYVRWENNLEWYIIDFQKADFSNRKRGQWWITKKGEDVAEETTDVVYELATKAYKTWSKEHKESKKRTAPKESKVSKGDSESSEDAYNATVVLEDAQDKALFGIQERLKNINPYEFQDFVADILTATGLTVQHVAPPGKDGGIDITATIDALGVQPHLQVQVKHLLNSGTKVSAVEVRSIRGAIDQTTDMGMLVSSSGFTKDAKESARNKSPRIKLIDLSDLLDLLDQHYDNLPMRGQKLLPLKKVYFLESEEDE